MILKGVKFDKSKGMFSAALSINGYKLLLGYYENYNDANDAYAEAVANRKNGAYKAYDDAYKEYMDKIELLSSVGTDTNPDARIISDTSAEFYEWMSGNFNIGTRMYKSDMYNEYLSIDDIASKYLSARRFFIWVDKYIKYKNYESFKGRDSKGRWIEAYIL